MIAASTRLQPFVHGFEKYDISNAFWPDPTVIGLPPGIVWDEGAWLTTATAELAAGIAFDTEYGQTTITAPLSCGISFDNAMPEAWVAPVSCGITLDAGMVQKAELTPYIASLSPGIRIPQDWIAQVACGIRLYDESLPAPTVTYCYNLRSENGAECTQFTGFDFIRIVRVGGVNYGLKSDGLYALGGNADVYDMYTAGIGSSFTLAPHPYIKDDAGRTWQARCPYVHITANTGGDVYVQTITDDSEDYEEDGPFSIDMGRGNSRRAQLARGIRSGLWGFRIENENGERMKVSQIDFNFEKLSRRI
jgi:hypothetical protein